MFFKIAYDGTRRKMQERHMAGRAGQQFGNYRLTRLLGTGGFAEVYLAEHMQLGMNAAIKILHAHLASDQISAFRQEARTIAELKHAHIIRVLDFDVQNGTPFLVLDYAPKGSLRVSHPKGSKLPLDLVVTYVEQVANALQYAHEHKLIHRDVKPENILLGEQGELLLTDFGIATIAHSTSSMNTQASMGTLAYMAPEQIQGKPRPASDQYALAVAVYQWLAGTLPFVGSSAEIIAQHLGAEPPHLRTQVPDLSRDVEQVVLTGLAKDPELRFSSVVAFAKALARASKGASVSPQPFPVSSATTQQGSWAGETPAWRETRTEAVWPASTPPVQSPPRTPIQPPLPQASSLGHWITRGVVCGLVLALVIGGMLWFTRQGDGTDQSPYRLSASKDVQRIGITLAVVSAASNGVCPTPTVVSWQYEEILGPHIRFSWQGLDSSQSYQMYSSLHGPDLTSTVVNGIPHETDFSSASNSSLYIQIYNDVEVTEGQRWILSASVSFLPSSAATHASSISCDYDNLYFQT
jgi:serine/threonine protein kinase